jgi:hypothetical protein
MRRIRPHDCRSRNKENALTRAQEWLKLAYAEHHTDFERLLTGFNKDQMGLLEQGAHHVQAMPMQQQPVQQQQEQAKAGRRDQLGSNPIPIAPYAPFTSSL